MSKDSCQYLFLRETSEAGESVGQGCSLFTCLNIAEQRVLLKSTEHFFSVLKCQAVANGIFCFLNPFLEPASIPCKFFPWSFAILIITYIILSNFFKKGYLFSFAMGGFFSTKSLWQPRFWTIIFWALYQRYLTRK